MPGAGKTLAGLNLANERHKFSEEEHAVFLSGNGPLVQVLQEALARNNIENSHERITKSKALQKAKAFIQNIHHFRDEALNGDAPPNEKVVVFDEAKEPGIRIKQYRLCKEEGNSQFLHVRARISYQYNG